MDIDFFSEAVWLAGDGVPAPLDGTIEDDHDAGLEEDRELCCGLVDMLLDPSVIADDVF